MELPLNRPPSRSKAVQEFHIPLEIIQTYKTNTVHASVYDYTMSLLKKNPECSYRFITDAVGIQLLKDHFDPSFLQAFQSLALGAAKGDFLRYVALYLFGGVYLDLDSGMDFQLSLFLRIHANPSAVFFYDGNSAIIQYCFMVAPKHPLLFQILEEMVTRIQHRENNIFLATGPTLVTDVIYFHITSSQIYNSTLHVSKDDRIKAWKRGCVKTSDRLMPLPSSITLRFPGYQFDMLYPKGHKRYKPTWKRPTPHFYVTADSSQS